MARDSFTFYREYAEAIEPLPPEEYKEVISAISHYSLDDIEIDIKNASSKAVFNLVKSKIDKSKQRAKNGKQGGRPKEEDLPRKEFEEYKYINITEEQYKKIVEKYGERVTMRIVELLDTWLAKNGKTAQQYIGKNHYAHFRADNWAVQKALGEQQQNRPNWGVPDDIEWRPF